MIERDLKLRFNYYTQGEPIMGIQKELINYQSGTARRFRPSKTQDYKYIINQK